MKVYLVYMTVPNTFSYNGTLDEVDKVFTSVELASEYINKKTEEESRPYQSTYRRFMEEWEVNV